MENFETKQTAEFNMAVSYLNRINVLMSACDETSMSLNSFGWFNALCATMRELSTWMSDEEIKQFNNKIISINYEIEKLKSQVMRSGKLETSNALYMELHTFELELRQVANKAGLLMKMTEDAMKALK